MVNLKRKDKQDENKNFPMTRHTLENENLGNEIRIWYKLNKDIVHDRS